MYELISVTGKLGLPLWLSGKESACRNRFDPWVGKIPPEKEMVTHCSVLA